MDEVCRAAGESWGGAQWAGGAGDGVIGGWRAGPQAGAVQRGGLRVRDNKVKPPFVHVSLCECDRGRYKCSSMCTLGGIR